MANLVGKTLGKYEISELLGKGGMAEVYKAYHPKLERFVTIKVLHSFLVEGKDFQARFEREAKAVATLRHPHIIQIHDFEVDGDLFYMVMEFIDGGTLQAYMEALTLKGEYMPLGRVLAILRQVAGALDYAHQHQIIHRDIKPSNILLDSVGNAYLADFGIARMMSSTQFTSTGSLIGTPTYMSPEAGLGEELTSVSDIYSLGVILYEMLTGKAPFTADTTPLAIIHKHIHESPPSPGNLRTDLSIATQHVILKALAKDPADRYQTAGEMVQDLEKALPLDLITELDNTARQVKAAIADMPTELISVNHAERVKIANSEPLKKTEDSLPTPIPTHIAEYVSEPVKDVKPEERSENMPVVKEKRKPAFAWWGLAFLVVLVVVAVMYYLNSNKVMVATPAIVQTPVAEESCDTVGSCISQAKMAVEQQDLQQYADFLMKAIKLITPGDQQRTYAYLWCDYADAAFKLNQLDAAVESYRTCFKWTADDPDLGDVRNRATKALTSLNQKPPQ